MRVRNSQTFLSLYYEPNTVEFATGGADPYVAAVEWERETRSLGQVATPRAVAALMAQWVMSRQPATVLDPAAGLGHLLHECAWLHPGAEFVGVERDVETLRRAIQSAPERTKLIRADYLRADAGSFDGIIANPPYVKAHRLDYTEANWRDFEELLGTPLDRLTNLYALFLLKIWNDLAPRGRAAVILPAEFLNANFGEEIKERMLRAMRPAGLLIFAPELNVFADALTTSAIVFLEKTRPKDAPMPAMRAASVGEAEAFVGELLAGPKRRSRNGCADLADFPPAEKWLNRLLGKAESGADARFPRRVGDYFDCRRGIATGANEFFCLTRDEVAAHGLNAKHFEPCVTKAPDVNGLVFTKAKLRALERNGRRCLLLNPPQLDAALERYLSHGEAQGIRARFLPSHRPVWYRPEKRAAAEIWVAVFSRESAKFILNSSDAKNLTCFHGLYAKPGCEHLAPLMTLFLNSTMGRQAFARVNRFYGDGLNKLEPKDVEAMPCPELPASDAASAAALVKQLVEIEPMDVDARRSALDELHALHLGVPQSAAA